MFVGMQLKHAIVEYVKLKLFTVSDSYFKPYRVPTLSKTSTVLGGSIHRLSYFGSSSFVFLFLPGEFNSDAYINLLKPTGYVMHQKFNIQQL